MHTMNEQELGIEIKRLKGIVEEAEEEEREVIEIDDDLIDEEGRVMGEKIAEEVVEMFKTVEPEYDSDIERLFTDDWVEENVPAPAQAQSQTPIVQSRQSIEAEQEAILLREVKAYIIGTGSSTIPESKSHHGESTAPFLLLNILTEDMRNTRINIAFLEDDIKRFFRRKVIELERALVLGLKRDQKRWWTEYCHMAQNIRNPDDAAVRSKHNIVKIKRIDRDKILNFWYPVIVVERSDHKEYTINEGDFPVVSLDDIDWLYNKLRSMTIRMPNDVLALNAVKRFMSAKIKHSMVVDFQMALENFQATVNLTKPDRSLPAGRDYELWTVIPKPFGIIYQSPSYEGKLLMRFSEIAKYSTGTLYVIQLQLKAKIAEVDRQPRGLHDRNYLNLKAFEAVNKRIRYRRMMQKFEMYFGIRRNQFSIRSSSIIPPSYQAQCRQERGRCRGPKARGRGRR